MVTSNYDEVTEWKIVLIPLPKPVVLDLFCGAGGLSLGFKMADYHIGLGVEKEALPYRTHCYNFGDICYLGDIRDITDPARFAQDHGLKQIDAIIGGPPCQGFSRVGRGKIRNLLNDPAYIHDPRNQYYREGIVNLIFRVEIL